MTDGEIAYLTPEARARVEIDRMLAAAGWAVQDASRVNLSAARGVAIREFVLKAPHGRADYLLFVDGAAAGCSRRRRRARRSPASPGRRRSTSTASPTTSDGGRGRAAVRLRVHRRRDPVHQHARPRRGQPGGLLVPPPRDARRLARGHREAPDRAHAPAPPAHPARARAEGPVARAGHRDLEPRGVARSEPPSRAHPDGDRLRQDVHRREHRVPPHQARRRAPRPLPRRPREPRPADPEGVPGLLDAGRRAQVHRALQRAAALLEHVDPVGRVTISTIQRLYSILRGETALDEELDEHSASRSRLGRLLAVDYNPDVPPELFDVIIVDECHRSIYGLWRQVLDYFDAFTIGLTATPNKQTFGFFNQNLVMEYTARAGGRRRGQRRLRRLPHPHGDHRARVDDRRRHVDRGSATAALAASAGSCSTTTSPTTPTSSTARSSPATRSAR